MKKYSSNKPLALVNRFKTNNAQIPYEVIDDTDVGVSARFLYVVAARIANFEGITWASNAKLSKVMNKSEQHVSTLWRELEKKGWATRYRRGVMKTNLTILHGFKNEVISEKDMNGYVEQANIAVEKWEWEEKFRKEKEGSD